MNNVSSWNIFYLLLLLLAPLPFLTELFIECALLKRKPFKGEDILPPIETMQLLIRTRHPNSKMSGLCCPTPHKSKWCELWNIFSALSVLDLTKIFTLYNEIISKRSFRIRNSISSWTYRSQSEQEQGVWKLLWGFPGGANGKEPACQCSKHKRCRFSPWVGKIPWRRAWQPTPVFLPGKSHGQRSLEGYSP